MKQQDQQNSALGSLGSSGGVRGGFVSWPFPSHIVSMGEEWGPGSFGVEFVA